MNHPAAQQNHRILVIDDNPAIHDDFKKILNPAPGNRAELDTFEAELFGQTRPPAARPVPFQIDSALQGEAGFTLVQQSLTSGQPYAMAFMDVRMPPGWDGIETTAKIWGIDPNLQIVVCTAHSDYSWDEMTAKLGVSHRLVILKKPFDPIEVLQLTHALTEKWHLTHRARVHLEEVERKVLEQTREFQEFAYAVSHDLQEPLRKVIAFGDRLREKCAPGLGKDGADYLTRMQDATKRMSVLINDLLELSRISTKAKPFVPVALNTIVSEVLLDLEVLMQKNQGQVEVGTLPTIDADPTQMRQLFQNLIGNALKFRKQDVAPLIQITAEPAANPAAFEADGEDGDRYWQIKVQDNGIGFEKIYREKIFEVFQRLHGRNEYQGSGIGLSICRKIVVRHNGSITAEATPGAGATFLITLPESTITRTSPNNHQLAEA